MSVPCRGTGAGTWVRWGQRSTPVVTGFLNSNDQVRGRPVGLAIDKSGALLFADDVGKYGLAGYIREQIYSVAVTATSVVPLNGLPWKQTCGCDSGSYSGGVAGVEIRRGLLLPLRHHRRWIGLARHTPWSEQLALLIVLGFPWSSILDLPANLDALIIYLPAGFQLLSGKFI